MIKKIVVALAALCALCGYAQATSPSKQVLAYYYTWFSKPVYANSGANAGTYFGSHWQQCNFTTRSCTGVPEYPVGYPASTGGAAQGPYDSGDQTTINNQFLAMKKMGITAVVVSTFGQTSGTTAHLPLIMNAAHVTGLKVSIVFETLESGTALSNLQYIIDQGYTSDPSYLTLNGNPVLWINSCAYHNVAGSCTGGGGNEAYWSPALATVAAAVGTTSDARGVSFAIGLDFNLTTTQQNEVKDGFASICYNYSTHADFQQPTLGTNMPLAQIQSTAPGIQQSLVNACSPAVKVAVFFPQQNGTIVHTNPDGSEAPSIEQQIVDNWSGGTLRATLSAAIAASPDWLMLVSWNEWGEDSMCEQSDRYGTTCSDASDVEASIANFMGVSVPAVTPPCTYSYTSNYVETKNVVNYTTSDGQNLTYDIYMPKSYTTPPPILVEIHGGGFTTNTRTSTATTAQAYAANGFAVANIDYRLVTGTPGANTNYFPNPVQDVRCAVRSVLANASTYGYDSTKLGITGDSAGGTLTLLSGYNGSNSTAVSTGDSLDAPNCTSLYGSAPYQVKAVMVLYPQVDFTNWLYHPGTAGFVDGQQSTSNPIAVAASPVNYINSNTPPTLIINGSNDTTLGQLQSPGLAGLLSSYGIDNRYYEIPGQPHGFTVYDPGNFNAGIMPVPFCRAISWLHQHLGG